ncbi:MAG: HD domain-containing protein [Acidobacteriota bacterium]
MIEPHIAWFEDHVRSFLTGNPEDDAHIELKREHSFKVLAEARAITPTLDLSPELSRAAHLAALYHDAGRFPQYRTYKTFRDAQSADHAHLGVRSLRGHAALSDLDTGMRALVLGAVVLHNRRELPRGIPDELSLVTRIVRDSDKLDIIRIMLDHLRPDGKVSDVVMLHVEDDPERYTSAIVAQIEAGRIGDYALMRYRNDFTLLLLSWVFDLSFRAARRAFLERGHLDELCGLLPRTPELTRIGDRIYDALNR